MENRSATREAVQNCHSERSEESEVSVVGKREILRFAEFTLSTSECASLRMTKSLYLPSTTGIELFSVINFREDLSYFQNSIAF